MEELQKLYDVLVREGKYTKTFDEFKTRWSQDEAYKTQVFDVVSRDGLYTKDKNSFFQKYSAQEPIQEVKNATSPVKKKFALDSSSEVGSSELPKSNKQITNMPELTQKSFEQAMAKKQSVPTDMSGKAIVSRDIVEKSEPIFKGISDRKKALDIEKKKYADVFDKSMTKPSVEQSKYLKDRLATVNTELINREEEFVVPELEYQFGDLGFKFEESGAMGDYVKVTAPNGKTTEISLDNLFSSKSKTQSDLLQNFIKQNTPAKGLFVLENTIKEQDKKFSSQKQVEDATKSITDDVNALNAKQKQFILKKNQFEKELQKLGTKPTKEQIDLLEQQKTALNEEMKSLLAEEEKIKTRGKKLDLAVGKYNLAKSKQGTWLGGISNSILGGVGSISSGETNLLTDIATEIAPSGFGMDPKELKSISKEIATKIGVTGPSEKQTVEQWKKTLTEGQIDAWEDEVDDYVKKGLKSKTLPLIRIGAKQILGDSETTQQWENLKKQDFWGGAILGVAESLPAIIGGTGPAGWVQRTAQMYAQVSDGLAQEMEKDPSFANISENEKLAVTLPIGITGAILEEIGLKNIKGSQGLINNLALRALGKGGTGVTAKTFRELVENEVENAITRGALTITAAGAAEFETGAAQELSATSIKEVYNYIKDEKMFDTPESIEDLVKNVAVAGAQEAVGGFILGVPTGVSAAYTEKGFLKMNDVEFETFAEMANDDKMQSAYIASLKDKITQGVMTTKEAKDNLNNYRNSVGLFRQLPDGLNTRQKKEAMNLLKEKKDLENYVEGKDPALVVKQKNRITEINDSLTKLTEEDAVQKQSTAEIPVQSETGISETMEGRKPETEPQVITEQITQEKVDALKDVESTTKAMQEVKDSNESKYADFWSKNESVFKQFKSFEELSEAYHKAKIDGTNPEIIKVVEDLLVPKAEEITTEGPPPMPEGFDVFAENKPTEVVAEKPEEVIPIKNAIDDATGVYYLDGQKGEVLLDGQTVVFETKDKIIDLGNIDELTDSTIDEFGINKEKELELKLNDDNSIELNGKKYINNYSDPESAFSKDKDGNYTVSLETENGQKRTFRGQQADQIVYETRLKNFEQNGTEQQIEDAHAAADEAIRIEEQIAESSPKRKNKSVRKGKQRTLKTFKEPLTKAERDAQEKEKMNEETNFLSNKNQLAKVESSPTLSVELNKLKQQKESINDFYERYLKAKADGTNPELVSSVDKLLATEISPFEDMLKPGTEIIYNGSKGRIKEVNNFVGDKEYNITFYSDKGPTSRFISVEEFNRNGKAIEENAPKYENPKPTKAEPKVELTIDEQIAQYIDEANSYQDEMTKVENDNSLTEEQKDSKINELEKKYMEALKKSNALAFEKARTKSFTGKDLLDLDTKDKTSLKRVYDYLDELDKSLDINPNELNDVTRVMAIGTAKAVIKTLKALVNAGITLQEAIKMASEAHKVKPEQIIDALDIVSKINENKSEGISEIELPGYNKLSKVIDTAISSGKTIDNILNYMNRSEVFKNATDVQKELLVREVRKRFGLKEKSAPSVGKLFGKIQDIAKITMTEKEALVKQIKDTAKGARESVRAFKLASQQLTKDIKELVTSGTINTKQAANILRAFSKVNVLNEVSVSNFVDYMTKVFNDAEYADKIDTAKSNLKTAKKNIVTKLGIADGLILPLQRLFSINPTLIPDAYLGKYLSLVDMFGKKQAVLTLEEKSQTIKDVQEILDEINNERSLVDELADRFNNSDNKVFKDDKLDYLATLNKMLEEGEIDNNEKQLMSKYKKDIVPQVEKSQRTEEEIQEEKDELIQVVKESKIDGTELPTKDERDLAKELNSLIKGKAINELTNTELKNLLKVIDNINNGYLPHYTQLMVEKLNSINNAISLETAVNKSKPLPLSKLYAKAKSLLTKKDAMLEMIRRNPLFNIDQVLGDFKTKDIFNSLFSKAAEAEAKFTSELKNVQSILEKAEEKVAKSFKLDANKTLMSKFKMMTYMVQLEYNSNPDNKQVNPAAEYLKATIKHIEAGKSQFGERDAKMLQDILDKYTDSEGNINNEKLYNSFNDAEKNAIKTVRNVNESLKDKAEYTAAIIRGQKINPLNNYVHLNVLHEYKPNDLASGESFANDYNNSMRPSTKAKSLIERTGKVSPLNFDVFTSAQRGAKFVLMDYHLTEPIRTARKTINKTISNMERKGKVSKEKRQIINAINNAFEESIENLVVNNYTETSIGDDVADYISRQGYRAVLAGTGRFVSEFLSNVGFVILSDPTSFTEGIKNMGLIMSADAPAIMNNVNSKETNRIFPTDTLSGRMIDSNILSQASGIKGGKSKNAVANKIQQIFNLSGKKYVNSIELLSDILISTPDKAIMRPIWFGSFAYNFKKITGNDVDFKKIAANDEAYMDKNKEALEEAKNIADERSVITGASSNAFTGILKGTSKPNQSITTKAFNNFNSFMSKFLIYEFVTARTGIMAAMGNGSLTKKQGVALLGAVATRMTVYSLLVKVLGEGIIGLLFDDEEEEDKKAPEKAVGQALASTFSSMLLGRDFGNTTKTLINYGVEQVNENYLDFLREGDYDPYKDALQYSAIPAEKKGTQTGIYDFLKNMTGSYGPAIKTADLVLKKAFEDDKKQAEAIERQEKEKNVRIPLEILGNLGLIPLYKEVRKSVMKDIYKGLEEEKKQKEKNAEEKAIEKEKLRGYKNKTEMKEKNPRLYQETFPEENKSDFGKQSFGSKGFGSSNSKSSGFGSKKFGQ